MLRLPRFRYLSPRSVKEASAMLRDAGPAAEAVAGGTDLWPKMKRRQKTPEVVVGLSGLSELRGLRCGDPEKESVRLCAGVTLAEMCADRALGAFFPGLVRAAQAVASPPLRNMGTLGGNLCVDTRCNYYDQSYEWRRSIRFCMKKDGDTCWVAPGSPRCWAVSSTDTAPMLMALSARVALLSADGERVIPVEQLFRDDGIEHLERRPGEILSFVEIPAAATLAGEGQLRSTYLKLRRRGSIDFPVLSVAAALALRGAGREAVLLGGRIALGAVASHPVLLDGLLQPAIGKTLSDERIAQLAEAAARLAKPLDNTDYPLGFRKRMAQRYVTLALRELRGDD